MTTRYVDIADATTFARTVADLDATYMADMRAKLGRGPAETIDSLIDARGKITGPAGRTITTKLCEPVVVAGTSGGLIVVEETVRAYAGVRAPSGRTITLVEVDAVLVRPALRTVIAATAEAPAELGK
jgi:hypothetical protein